MRAHKFVSTALLKEKKRKKQLHVVSFIRHFMYNTSALIFRYDFHNLYYS